MYQGSDYDLAGFAVGAVERGQLLPTDDIVEGDVLLGLASSGVHSNGFSLVRRIVAEIRALAGPMPAPFADGQHARPKRCSSRPASTSSRSWRRSAARTASRRSPTSPAAASPTTSRACCPKDFAAELDLEAIELPAVFSWLARTGGVAPSEMMRTFNCGVGMVLVVASGQAAQVAAVLQEAGEDGGADRPHRAAARRRRDLSGLDRPMTQPRKRTVDPDLRTRLQHGRADRGGARTGVSGRDRRRRLRPRRRARPQGCCRASASRPGCVPRKDHPTAEAHEKALDAALARLKAEIVCLAGYMRVLTAGFVDRWQGRLVNIHPALLPAFPGLDTHRRALDAGLLIHGCSVHFVTHEVDDRTADRAGGGAGARRRSARAAFTARAQGRAQALSAGAALLAAGKVRLEGGRAVFADIDQSARTGNADIAGELAGSERPRGPRPHHAVGRTRTGNA